MYLVISFSLLAILLTFLESQGKIKHGMLFGFILLTTLAAIHYDYGMDYMSYMETYDGIKSGNHTLVEVISSDLVRQNETGWALINWFFSFWGKYGFFWMVAILSVFQNVIYYLFIRRFVPQTWWAMAIFIYVFSTHYYLINFSMMRQGLAIALVLWSYNFISQKRLFPALLILVCAPFIHRSSMVMLPFVFWEYIPLRNGRLYAIAYVLLFSVLFFGQNVIDDVFGAFSEVDEFQYYMNAHGNKDNNTHFGIGFLLNMVPFAVSLWFLCKRDADLKEKKLVALSSIGAMIIPFTQVIALASRVGLYFSVFSLASVPYAYRAINNKVTKTFLVFIYVGMFILDYYIFFKDPVFLFSYVKFNTIFSVI